jgi:hypothetical protein
VDVEHLIDLLQRHVIDLILLLVAVVCIGLAILLRMNPRHSKEKGLNSRSKLSHPATIRKRPPNPDEHLTVNVLCP